MSRNFLISSLRSSFGDRIIGILLVLLAVGLIGVGGWIVFLLIDTAGISPTHTTQTTVEAKNVVPAHYTTTLMPSGDVMIPVMTLHPGSYRLRFRIHSQAMDINVDQESYNRTNIGDRIMVEYGSGRLTGSYVPIRMQPLP